MSPRPEDRQPADELPVARLCVDVPLAHLDRPFDYLVPTTLDDSVRPGSRVRVRFAGKLVDGYVLERVQESEHGGRLSYIERAISAEPVLAPEIARLARVVADRYAGSLTDVLRLAIPPRHARVEAEEPKTAAVQANPPPTANAWSDYTAGPAFLKAIAAHRPARAVWSALPGEDWPIRLAEAIAIALQAGRGAVVVVPDQRDLDRVDAACTSVIGTGQHVALSAELGAAERYRRWLAVRRGAVRAVVGMRAAALAPVADVGLLAIWDDGDDLHAEQRAPYPHARDVLVLRSHQSGAALLVAAHGRTAEAAQLVSTGWAHEIVAPREVVRRRAPRVVAAGDDELLARDEAARSARLPSVAFRAARAALDAGRPVLVQVPRRGYAPSLACQECRSPARCKVCQGPLASSASGSIAFCRWCGATAANWACNHCGASTMRAAVVGARRTAEELGRAFPEVSVRTSGGGHIVKDVPAKPALVVATPGAEPVAEDGYGAALLLDAWALLTRADLRAAEETLRRWANAASLVVGADDGGTVVVVGADAGLPVVQALVRWDVRGYAERELADRVELGFPPALRFAELTGTPDAIRDLVDAARLPDSAEQLGPVPANDESLERLLIRVPRHDGATLAVALHAASGVRSARKASDAVRVRLDPVELG